jgi:predicted DsbA family dithiol-disulfide isomerase
MPLPIAVYFDYLCPFAWRGAEVAEIVGEQTGLRFEWHHFSLYQSNYRGDDRWQLWNDPIVADDGSGGKGLVPFLASCAARKQGGARFDAFRLALMRARHRDHRPLDVATIREVAAESGLHVPRFDNDLSDPECRTVLAQEHHEATCRDVFGTPTFFFQEGQGAYFRIRELPRDSGEALSLFEDFRTMLEEYPYLETVKRPRPRRN